MIDGNYMDTPILQLIRNINAIKSKKAYIHSQVKSIVNKIDIKVRNNFYKGTIISILKYSSKFNHGSKDGIINKGLTSLGCS